MIGARPRTPESGSPAAIDFATVIRSGSTSYCSIAKNVPVRAKPVCTSSTIRTIPLSSQIRRTPAMNSDGARNEAAFALDRLEHDRGDRFGRHLGHEHALERRQRGRGVGAAVVLGKGNAVDLGRERAEPCLVRMRLRGQRKREQRAAVESSLERDHRGPPRVRPCELDGVLDRLRAGVEEGGLRRAGDRGSLEQPLGELDVELVRDDREVGVGETVELLADGGDDPRM